MSRQSLQALRLARQTRTDRMLITSQFRSGELGLDEVLTAECCWSMDLWQLLAFVPWWGRQRAKRVLGPVGLDGDQKVGQLTDRQRALLVAAYQREMVHMSSGRRKRRAS